MPARALLRPALLLAALAAALVPSPVRADEPASNSYRLPPDNIRRVLDTPPTPTVSLSPTHETLLFLDRPSLPPIADLAAPMLRLAGSRLNPNTNSPHGPRRYTGFSLRASSSAPDSPAKKLDLPADANLSAPGWSADGKYFVFTNIVPNGTELWIGEAATATVRKLAGPTLNGATGASARWLPDQRSLLVKFIPQGRAPIPVAPTVPTGPVIQDADGTPAPVRTFQDLLQNSYDEAVFDWIATSQLAIIDVVSGERRDLGAPAIFSDATPSPSGDYLLVARLQKPYSYQVPWGYFPETIEVWNLRDTAAGKAGSLAKHLFDVPLRENIPTMGVETGPRSIEWSDTRPATLVWAEALDEGDPRKKVPHRDRVMMLAAGEAAAPFAGTPREFTKLQHRYSGLSWLERTGGQESLREAKPTDAPDRVLVSEYERERRWARTWLISLDAAGAPLPAEPLPAAGAAANQATTPAPTVLAPTGGRLVFDRSVNDQYNNPGSPLSDITKQGFPVVKVDAANDALYLRGQGATPEGDRPFFDRMKLADFSKERLWRNDGECYETVIDLVEYTGPMRPAPKDFLRVITSYETRTTPPNLYVLDLGGRAKGGDEIKKQAAPSPDRSALTSFKDPLPQLRSIKKEIITYTRDDGVPLSATMYLPPDYTPGTKLPLVIWAYPNEVSDAATAGQVSGSEYRFTQIGGTSHLFLLLAGYAVMDDASMPVIGDAETMNDTFVKQIVASAKAAIDKAADMGVADPTRVAVGGHSYGAFMTANLLAHCPQGMFRAGIARSGAYNRTLTPFGFQSERRSYWEAPDVYTKLSPFSYADKIKTPLLMTHGQLDANSGTFPMQSERLFQAIKGNGGTARLVLLPYESHGYMARESVMHVLTEMIDWLDRYVKSDAEQHH
jgi:dipeptidyl aminopeptidase/acylaminoacyl peptidase